MRYAKISVKALVDDTLLEAEDFDVEGNYAIELREDYQPRNPLSEGDDPEVEQALDYFHDHIAIGCLDHFDIKVEVFDEIHDDDILWI
jgi:hypothetical protein